jgi:hypothetical protein
MQRKKVTDSRFVAKSTAAPTASDLGLKISSEQTAESLWQAEAERNLEEEEELFNQEASISKPTPYTWEDKYRPRKPRYFNRVHTGYEWNKYNQTHYE